MLASLHDFFYYILKAGRECGQWSSCFHIHAYRKIIFLGMPFFISRPGGNLVNVSVASTLVVSTTKDPRCMYGAASQVMCVCMRVCVCVCMCVCVYVCVCIYIYIYLYIYMCVYVFVCVYVCERECKSHVVAPPFLRTYSRCLGDVKMVGVKPFVSCLVICLARCSRCSFLSCARAYRRSPSSSACLGLRHFPAVRLLHKEGIEVR